MENITQTKVGKIVAQNFRTAKVLSSYGIDFCCRGGITLAEACQQHSVEIEELLPKLEAALQMPDEIDYSSLDIRQLVDRILSKHHEYIRTTSPILQAYLDKIAKVHGERHPELHQIRDLFAQSAEDLQKHLWKEENVLFPYILEMEQAKAEQKEIPEAHFGNIENPIRMMEHEHDIEGERFRQISKISNQYQAPNDACQTYRVAFSMLDEFEKDLHTHIHLENNLLFPKAKAVFEESLVS